MGANFKEYQEYCQQRFSSKKLASKDAMVHVQKMTKKSATVVTAKNLSEYFNDRVLSMMRCFEYIILLSDTYKGDFLKTTTRVKHRHGKEPVQYQVRGVTSISASK